MSQNVQNINKVNTGNCPHGLPPGACPVCSQSGGGTLRQSDRNRRVGEMTYHECAMIGNMMKARALAQKNHEANLKQHFLNVKNFELGMEKLMQNMRQFMEILSKTALTKPVTFVLNITVMPILSIIQTIPKIFQTIAALKFEITDKLNAVYGEAKAILNKKLEEISKIIKSAVDFVSKIFKKHNADDDDTKIDDDKKIFNLKTILHKLKEKYKKKKDKKR